MELLAGMPAGVEDAGGHFPRDTVNARAAARLAQFEAAALPKRSAQKGAQGNGRRQG